MNFYFISLAVLLGIAPLTAQADPVAPATQGAKPKAVKTSRVAGNAYIRVLNGVVGGPALDIYAGAAKIASGLTFKSLGHYVAVKSGQSAFIVVPTGRTAPIIVSQTKFLAKDKFYSVVIAGKGAESLLFVNDSAGKEMPDKARLRVIHAAPGAPDVLVTAPSARGIEGYANLLPNPLSYLKAASKTVKPMTTSVQIRTIDGHLVKEVPGVMLAAGKRYDAFALGEVGTSFDVVVAPAATK